jgi:hypothetical protein
MRQIAHILRIHRSVDAQKTSLRHPQTHQRMHREVIVAVGLHLAYPANHIMAKQSGNVQDAQTYDGRYQISGRLQRPVHYMPEIADPLQVQKLW